MASVGYHFALVVVSVSVIAASAYLAAHHQPAGAARWAVLGVASAGVALGTALGIAAGAAGFGETTGGTIGGTTGGRRDPGATRPAPPALKEKDPAASATFHGETVQKTLVPTLEAIVAEKLGAPPTTYAELVALGGDAGPYESFRPNVDAVLHRGQRKLLLAEVGFLARHGHLADEVVYVGSAPGVHIPFLAWLFPRHRFVLYDANPFGLRGHPETRDRIEVRRQYFTDADVAEFARAEGRPPVLFVSDIRTGDFGKGFPRDMAMQQAWAEAIRPAACSLKFRLPWEPGTTRYLDGEVYLQAWAPKATNETRLEARWTDSGVPPRRAWDHAEYDERLHFLNEGLRQWAWYAAGAPAGVPGGDHCFDCALEAATWEMYRAAHREHPGRAARGGLSVAALMTKTSAAIGQGVDIAPHGLLPDTPMAEKREELIRRCEAGEFRCNPSRAMTEVRIAQLEDRRKKD